MTRAPVATATHAPLCRAYQPLHNKSTGGLDRAVEIRQTGASTQTEEPASGHSSGRARHRSACALPPVEALLRRARQPRPRSPAIEVEQWTLELQLLQIIPELIAQIVALQCKLHGRLQEA